MPRPTTKAELLDAAAASHAKVLGMLDTLGGARLQADFAFDDRDRNARDVLVHLHEWHLLLLEWVRANESGTAAAFLPDGYTWADYQGLNVEMRDRHSDTSLDQAVALYVESRHAVMTLIESHTDEELFTKKHYPWTGTTSLGAYCVSCTSSHDEWALKKLRKHARG